MKEKSTQYTLWLSLILFPLTLFSLQKTELQKSYQKWLKEEVIYIITPREKEVFSQLQNDRERNLFIEEFWRQRDPTPGTQRNEYKDEHYRRIEYANQKFGRGTPTKGWRTDRGRFYIMLGKPYDVERFTTSDTYPIEIWHYFGNPRLGQAPLFRLLFFQDLGVGDYQLYDPISDGPKRLVPFTDRTDAASSGDPKRPGRTRVDEISRMRAQNMDRDDINAWLILRYNVSFDLAQAAFSNFPGSNGPENRLPSMVLLGEVESYPQKRVDDDYAYEFLEHKAVVEVNYSAHYMGNESKVRVIQDPAGQFFVNYVIQPEILSVDFFGDKYFADLKSSVRLVDSDGKTIYQGERNIPIELREEELKILEKSSFHLFDSFPMIPGDFTFYFLLENMVTKEFTSFEKKISVPDAGSLDMTPPILARKVNRDSPYSELNRAFQVGNIQVYPSVDNTFAEKDTLFVFFQVYALSQKLREGGRLEYTFSQDGKAVQTVSKKVSEYQYERAFLEEFSLSKVPAGEYTINIALLDGTGQELLFRSAPLSVTSESLPPSWVVAQSNPPAEDPYTSFVLGRQYLNRGELTKAYDELLRAYEARADSLDYAIGYARVLWMMKDANRLKEILLPFAQAEKKNFELYYYLGRSFQETGDLAEAIGYYQKALSHRGNVVDILNSVGDCYLELGEKEQALRAWEKSLEINPKQERIRKIVESLK